MKTFTGMCVGTCVTALAASSAGYAQEAVDNGPFRPGWYLAPMLSYTKADSARRTDDGQGLALAFGHRGDFATLELGAVFTTLSPKTGSGSDARLSGGSLGLVVGPFFEDAMLSRLFGVVGFGVFKRKNHPGFAQDDSTIFGDVGAGYLQPLPWRPFGFDLNARGELRYRYDVQQPPRPAGTPAQFQDYVLNVGLQIPLSSRSAVPEASPEPVAVVEPANTDADQDGVSDAADQCPGTPAGTVVNDVGCVPAAPAAPAAPAPVVLAGLYFATNSAELSASARDVLDSIAADLLTRPEESKEIGGHTDSVGNDAFNQDLSQRRAESVRAYLIEKGVNADQLTAVGYGETQPLEPNESAEGRARNRRVELKVLDGAAAP